MEVQEVEFLVVAFPSYPLQHHHMKCIGVADRPVEAQELCQDFLVRVTRFFRDEEVFEALKEGVFPRLVEERSPNMPLRFWVAGCATGEEVYSLAIVLLEFLNGNAAPPPIKILATDLNESALERARAGVYVDNIEIDVSPERLRRFFVRVEGNYQISNFVIGVEGTFDWAANNNNNNVGVVVPAGILGIGPHTLQVTANDKWIATLAARLGLAYDRVLFYAKGGGAWIGANSLTITDVTAGTSITGSTNNTLSGWLVGAGIEWAFANNWTVKAEYDYIGLSSRTFVVPVGSPFLLAGDTFTTSGTNNVQMATVGINFLFGAGRY